MKQMSPLLIHIGRIALASLFILGGINKLFDYSSTLQSMLGHGLPSVAVSLPLVIGLELCGGILIALGRRWVTTSALALACFTMATNFIFHDFWTMEGIQADLEMALFFKNISIAGALILLAGVSAKTEDSFSH